MFKSSVSHATSLNRTWAVSGNTLGTRPPGLGLEQWHNFPGQLVLLHVPQSKVTGGRVRGEMCGCADVQRQRVMSRRKIKFSP